MKHLTVFLCLAGAVAIALAVSAPVAEANDLECGAEIWENTKLTEDLDCSGLDLGPWGAGLRIKGDNVTLDLGGHTIFGPWGGGGVVAARHTTIKNGTITGFRVGVRGPDAYDLEVKNLLFTDQSRAGVNFGDAEGVVIKDSMFIGQEEAGVRFEESEGVEIKDSTFIDSEVAIGVGESEDVSIKNIDASDCYVCVDAWGENKDVEIKDSTFHDMGTAMWFPPSTGVKISGNHISGRIDEVVDSWGIFLCGSLCTPTSAEPPSIEIKNNFIHHVDMGIGLWGDVTGTKILDNHVYNNSLVGIWVVDASYGNEIMSNLTFGNEVFDLWQDDTATPNEWKDNRWETCHGSEIPGCPDW